MFPHVEPKQGIAFYVGNIHQGIVLVGRRADLQVFSAIQVKPRPAAAEAGFGRFGELRFEIGE